MPEEEILKNKDTLKAELEVYNQKQLRLLDESKKEKVVVRILKEDFNKVEIGDTVEIAEKKELSLFTRCNFPYYEFVRKIK